MSASFVAYQRARLAGIAAAVEGDSECPFGEDEPALKAAWHEGLDVAIREIMRQANAIRAPSPRGSSRGTMSDYIHLSARED